MWTYYIDGVEYGPIDQMAMEYLYQEGIIPPETEIRKHTWKSSKPLCKSPPFKDMPIVPKEVSASEVPFPPDRIKPFPVKQPEIGIKYLVSLPMCIGAFLTILFLAMLIVFATCKISFIMILLVVFLSAISIAGGAAGMWAWKQEKVQEVQLHKEKLQLYQAKLLSHKEKLETFRRQQTEIQEKVLDRHIQAIRESLTLNDKTIQHRANALAEHHLSEMVHWLTKKMTTSNYSKSKTSLTSAINSCRAIGYEISDSKEEQLINDLKENFERLVRMEAERQEQARIRAQIREEQKIEREKQRLLDEAASREKAIQAALEEALKQSDDEHSAEIERLQEELQKAREASERAKSQAQLTKAGYIYVISNIGSFGEGVFKVGMTRRLEPLDRVRELGDASVPFRFDVHMMISCEDAPKLENTLHKELHRCRVNKVNPRKEFFRVDIDTIRQHVLKHHGNVDYTVDPEALEYFQSLEMSDADAEYIEEVMEREAFMDFDD